MSMTVHIVTPEGGHPVMSADHITLPAYDGEMGIRNGHAAIVALLGAGSLWIKSKSVPDEHFIIQGGFAQVASDEVHILADSVVKSADVSEMDLAERLQALAAERYENAIERSKAKAEAEWIAAQLRAKGKTVPPYTIE